MINIVMVVCAMHAPGHCKNVRLNVTEPGLTAYACVARGETEIAKWSGENPEWRVAGYVCRKAGGYATIARTFQRGSELVGANRHAYAFSRALTGDAR